MSITVNDINKLKELNFITAVVDAEKLINALYDDSSDIDSSDDSSTPASVYTIEWDNQYNTSIDPLVTEIEVGQRLGPIDVTVDPLQYPGGINAFINRIDGESYDFDSWISYYQDSIYHLIISSPIPVPTDIRIKIDAYEK